MTHSMTTVACLVFSASFASPNAQYQSHDVPHFETYSSYVIAQLESPHGQQYGSHLLDLIIKAKISGTFCSFSLCDSTPFASSGWETLPLKDRFGALYFGDAAARRWAACNDETQPREVRDAFKSILVTQCAKVAKELTVLLSNTQPNLPTRLIHIDPNLVTREGITSRTDPGTFASAEVRREVESLLLTRKRNIVNNQLRRMSAHLAESQEFELADRLRSALDVTDPTDEALIERVRLETGVDLMTWIQTE